MNIREFLEVAYQLYPRKLGKSQGIKVAMKSIKTKEDLEKLKLAIGKYRAHIEREKTEAKFVMYFSTFMNQWMDWLEDGHGVTEVSQVDKWAKLKERA